MQILWNRLLVEKQVIVSYRHKAMPQTIYYLFPSMAEAEREMGRIKSKDPGIQTETIRYKAIKDVFLSAA